MRAGQRGVAVVHRTLRPVPSAERAARGPYLRRRDGERLARTADRGLGRVRAFAVACLLGGVLVALLACAVGSGEASHRSLAPTSQHHTARPAVSPVPTTTVGAQP